MQSTNRLPTLPPEIAAMSRGVLFLSQNDNIVDEQGNAVQPDETPIQATLDNGEPVPPELPPPGVPMPPNVIDKAFKYKRRMLEDPGSVPYPIHVWLRRYENQASSNNT